MAKCNRTKVRRHGFTLLELILALGLSVLVMSIIVGLIGLYSSNFTTRGEDIRRVALARAVLNMIADDLRSTVTKQEYDTKVLEQMLMGQGVASAGGGASDGGDSAGGGQTITGPAGGGPNNGNNGRGNNQNGNNQGGGQNNGGGNNGQQNNGRQNNNNNNQNNNAQSGGGGGGANNQNNNQRNQGQGNTLASGQGGQNNRGGGGGGGVQMMGGGMPTTGGQSSQSGSQSQQSQQSGQGDQAAGGTDEASDSAAPASLPLGIYGSATNLTIDVSRIPRMDEYNAQQNGLLNGTLNDLPGDIKSVSYFVQTPSTMGVTDAMDQVSSTQTNANGVAGLVRRALDRAVMDNAESTGQSTQLNRTGELVAPEVLALEFSYYDGTQWTTTWDSSTQGLP